ncbi:MAG: hypothetical protein ABSB42_04620 [Tepidisphaeraceae bacterium]|jgi:hypothetical protein
MNGVVSLDVSLETRRAGNPSGPPKSAVLSFKNVISLVGVQAMSNNGDNNGDGRAKPPEMLAVRVENSQQKKAEFLVAFGQVGNMTRAAESVGITRRSAQKWANDDPVFAEELQQAKLEAADRLIEEARRRAKDGLLRMKFHGGEPIIDPRTKEPYFEMEYSDVLLIVLLKGLLPEQFRENYTFDHNMNLHVSGEVNVASNGDFLRREFARELAAGGNAGASN